MLYNLSINQLKHIEAAMSYREEIREMIAEHLKNRPLKEGSVDRIIRRVYANALEETKRTGGSVESMTYEILEGIGEGLSSYPKEVEPTLQRSMHMMLDLLTHSARVDIRKKERMLQAAQNALREAKAIERASLHASLDALRAYAHEHRYGQLEKHYTAIQQECDALRANEHIEK